MEIIAVILTLISAYYTVKVNVLCWPSAILATLIYIYLVFNEHLYGQVIADTIILGQCIYGWYYWKATQDESCILLNHNIWVRDLLIVCLIGFITVPLLKRYTDNPQAELDVLTTLLSMLGNWYLAKKYIHGFFTWIIADVLFIIMFLNQGMYWSAILFFILIGFSIKGATKWVKNMTTV